MAKGRKGVTPTFKELLADLKPMTFGQKLDHLWSYYKEYLLVVFLIGIVIAIFISSYFNGKKQYLLKGMMINITIDSEGYRYLTDDFKEKIGTGDKYETVLMEFANFRSLADAESSEDNYNTTMMIIARVSAGQLDAALVDQLALEFYINQEIFGDLRTCFTQEQLDALGEGKVWNVAFSEDEEVALEDIDLEDPDLVQYPMAILVSDLPFFKELAPNNEKIYLVVSANNPNREAVQAFWEHLNSWEKTK